MLVGERVLEASLPHWPAQGHGERGCGSDENAGTSTTRCRKTTQERVRAYARHCRKAPQLGTSPHDTALRHDMTDGARAFEA